jgi:hypothetical protein
LDAVYIILELETEPKRKISQVLIIILINTNLKQQFYQVMKKPILSSALILCLFLGIISCKDEMTNIVNTMNIETTESKYTVVGNRIRFANSEAFYSTIKELNEKSSGSSSFFDEWEQEINFISLRTHNLKNRKNILEDFRFPMTFASILNERGEYMIGDTIVWYNKGLKHFIPNKNEELLSRIKLNPSLSKNTAKAGGNIVKTKMGNGNLVTQSTIIQANSQTIEKSHAFSLTGDGANQRRWVYELVSYIDYIGSGADNYYVELFMRFKLQWLSPSNNVYYQAGDPRTYGIDIYCGNSYNLPSYTAYNCQFQYWRNTNRILNTIHLSGNDIYEPILIDGVLVCNQDYPYEHLGAFNVNVTGSISARDTWLTSNSNPSDWTLSGTIW